MNSIGDLIDKLVIENIKIFTIREKLHSKDIIILYLQYRVYVDSWCGTSLISRMRLEAPRTKTILDHKMSDHSLEHACSL